MIKYKELRKKTVKAAVVSAAVLGVVLALYVGVSMLSDSIAEQKSVAEGAVDAKKGLLASLSDQMDKSGEAEKRYVAIQEKRVLASYETDIKELKDYLAKSKLRYKFSDLKIRDAQPVVSDKPELANFPYNIRVWNRFRISLRAVSDVHIFSFLDDFRVAVPGFIRIDMIDIKRVSDLSDASLAQIKDSGVMPLNVEAKIEFTWVGLSPKPKNPASPSPSTPTP